VVFYHAKFSVADWHLLPGGYLGVDIFFVISGYLITTLLMTELVQSGRISITYFYERRARRLLPGLMLVMLVSLPFAWRYLLPDQLVDFSKSLVFSIGFVSNFYWNYSLQQYGAASALFQPFLHTWSLAVEEQYYIIFPLFLFAIYKYGRKYLAGILLFAVALSLLLSEWMTGSDASFSFYMMPTRFWELLTGSLLALAVLNRKERKLAIGCSYVLSLLGLLMILGSLLYIDFGIHHPGFITLVPVLGTVLVILSSENAGWVTRVLSARPMVYLGLLSYSLYLWHYPIFAFGRMQGYPPTLAHKIVWIGLTLVLSALSYHLVEKPLRGNRTTRKTFLVSLLSVSLVLLSICFYWIREGGLPDRGGYLLNLIKISANIGVSQDGVNCHSTAIKTDFLELSESCEFIYSIGSPTLVLVGDSHAGAIGEPVRALAARNQLNFVQVTQAACPHLQAQMYCSERSEALGSYLSQLEKPTIIYSARLPLYIEQEAFDGLDGQPLPEKKFFRQMIIRSPKQWADAVAATLTSWVDKGYGLVILYPVPEQGFDVFQKLKRSAPFAANAEDLPTLSTDYNAFKKRVATSYTALDRVKGARVDRVYPEKIFCKKASGTCIASEHERLYFATDNHVARLGGELIARQIAVVLNLKIPDSFAE